MEARRLSKMISVHKLSKNYFVLSLYLRNIVECLSESAEGDQDHTQSCGFGERGLGSASWKG